MHSRREGTNPPHVFGYSGHLVGAGEIAGERLGAPDGHCDAEGDLNQNGYPDRYEGRFYNHLERRWVSLFHLCQDNTNLLRISLLEAFGFRVSIPTLCRQAPHACPTKVEDVASSAWTGTIIRPQRMVLNTPQAYKLLAKNEPPPHRH